MLSPSGGTSSTSATASPSSGHLRQLPPMLSSRREALARRAPLHPTASVTVANRRRCSPLEEKHQLDECHCIHQQRSPSSTTTDARLSRRSTGSTSTTACTSSSHHRQQTPMIPSRRGTPARRVPLPQPAAATFAHQRR
jgi:hypothetical protein